MKAFSDRIDHKRCLVGNPPTECRSLRFRRSRAHRHLDPCQCPIKQPAQIGGSGAAPFSYAGRIVRAPCRWAMHVTDFCTDDTIMADGSATFVLPTRPRTLTEPRRLLCAAIQSRPRRLSCADIRSINCSPALRDHRWRLTIDLLVRRSRAVISLHTEGPNLGCGVAETP